MLRKLKELLIGSPLDTAALHEQRLSKKSALAILASDNLSSTAYATEEILLALATGAAAGLAIPLLYSIPIGLAIGLLTLIVVISYGQTLYAYPGGGGAYAVAKENLGILPALLAGSSLLIDYSLTVAVSVAAGIAAITSAFPALYEHKLALSLIAVLVILTANLRGVRESAALFAGPTYLFILSAYTLVIGGLIMYALGKAGPTEAAPAAAASPEWNLAVTFLVLRAFASGCAALTGIEAVATGVQVFEKPVARNASVTLYILAAMLGTLFVGITILAVLYNVTAAEGETVLSQLSRTIFGTGPIYYTIQGSAAPARQYGRPAGVLQRNCCPERGGRRHANSLRRRRPQPDTTLYGGSVYRLYALAGGHGDLLAAEQRTGFDPLGHHQCYRSHRHRSGSGNRRDGEVCRRSVDDSGRYPPAGDGLLARSPPLFHRRPRSLAGRLRQAGRVAPHRHRAGGRDEQDGAFRGGIRPVYLARRGSRYHQPQRR
jgi:hypothetical protein